MSWILVLLSLQAFDPYFVPSIKWFVWMIVASRVILSWLVLVPVVHKVRLQSLHLLLPVVVGHGVSPEPPAGLGDHHVKMSPLTWQTRDELEQCRGTRSRLREALAESERRDEKSSPYPRPHVHDQTGTWREGRNTCRDPRNSPEEFPLWHCGRRQLVLSFQFFPAPKIPTIRELDIFNLQFTWLTPEM